MATKYYSQGDKDNNEEYFESLWSNGAFGDEEEPKKKKPKVKKTMKDLRELAENHSYESLVMPGLLRHQDKSADPPPMWYITLDGALYKCGDKYYFKTEGQAKEAFCSEIKRKLNTAYNKNTMLFKDCFKSKDHDDPLVLSVLVKLVDQGLVSICKNKVIDIAFQNTLDTINKEHKLDIAQIKHVKRDVKAKE